MFFSAIFPSKIPFFFQPGHIFTIRSMATPKPTIVLVPGAWHKPEAFQPLTSLLESAGYTCIGVDLASVGAKTPLEGTKEDIEAIKNVITPEVEADRDVVVLMHSYGSVPAGEAVKGLDQASRRKDGGRGGVTHLFYCAAFAPPKGKPPRVKGGLKRVLKEKCFRAAIKLHRCEIGAVGQIDRLILGKPDVKN